jgi:hypothetical protein
MSCEEPDEPSRSAPRARSATIVLSGSRKPALRAGAAGCGVRALKLVRALTLFVIMGGAGPVLGQSGADERWPTLARVEITLVGPEAALASVREVATDLLSRDGVAVLWRNADRLRAEEVLEAPPGARGAPVAVWVDGVSGPEARIYFRAAAGRRFVIRRVSLPGGLGPLAVEEIAQIIQSVLHALASDTAWALSLSEARAALSVPERRPSPAAPPAPGRATVVEIGSALAGQLYAPELPLTGNLELSVAALSRPATTSPPAFPGSLGGRLALGYGFPAHFTTGAVGADLRAARTRLELIWEPWRTGRVAIRLGLGGGVDLVAYAPTAELPGATAAAGGTFVNALGCADAALHLDVSSRLALMAAVLAEISLERVHYDAYDASGNLGEVLVPHRLRPGVAIGMEVRL